MDKEAYLRQLQDWINSFSEEQLEAMHYYGYIINKAFSGRRGPEGKIIHGFLRVQFSRVGENEMEARMPLRWEMYNGMGIIHGGVLATFIDNAMGNALHTLHPGNIIRQMTIDLNIHYLKGVKGKEIVARSRLVQAGRSIAVLDTDVYDEEGDMVCKATGTFRVMLQE